MNGVHIERVDSLIGDGAEVISDTIPAWVFEAVIRYYGRHGYELFSWTVVGSGGLVSATFVLVAEEG